MVMVDHMKKLQPLQTKAPLSLRKEGQILYQTS